MERIDMVQIEEEFMVFGRPVASSSRKMADYIYALEKENKDAVEIINTNDMLGIIYETRKVYHEVVDANMIFVEKYKELLEEAEHFYMQTPSNYRMGVEMYFKDEHNFIEEK